MIFNVQGPKNSISTTIHVNEIVRVETCVLKFFGNKLFNLYIIVKADGEENFHLFPYARLEDFKEAHTSITNILAEKPHAADAINIGPSFSRGTMLSNTLA